MLCAQWSEQTNFERGDAVTVDTKSVERRDITFATLADISADIDRIEAAHRAGSLRTTGNWSAGQVFEHISILMECAIDGFPSQMPAPMRWMAILLYKKKALSGEKMPAGFKLPKGASFLIPHESTTTEEGLARLRTVLARIDAGERFNQPSPVFGTLTHDQWCTLQAGHATLHLSFIHY